MKKILVIHTKYRITGGEDIAVEKEVAELKKNYTVETLYFSNKNTDNYLLELIRFVTSVNLQANREIENKITQFQPDIVYIHNTWFKSSLGIIKILKKSNIKFFIKLHNYRFDCGRYFTKFAHLRSQNICSACGLSKKKNIIFNKYFQDSYIKSIFLIIYSKRYFKLLRESSIVTLTDFQKNFLIERNFRTENIFKLVNPMGDVKRNLEMQTNIFPPKSFLIYAGLISFEKGVQDLIDTYNLLVNFDKKLLIAGEGPLLNKLKNKNKNKNIVFLGQISNDAVISFISKSYSVITNTKLYEGQPTLLSEASKLGINSVYPKSGGISEFFPENNPFAFKSGDKIDLLKKLKLLKHEEIVNNQSRSNSLHIETLLSTETYFEKFKELTEKC